MKVADTDQNLKTISDETRSILLRLYSLHDRIATAVIRAGADTLYSAHGVAIEALNEADAACDEVEWIFGLYLTAQERGLCDCPIIDCDCPIDDDDFDDFERDE